MNVGVKLCIAINTLGCSAFARRSNSLSMRAWYG